MIIKSIKFPTSYYDGNAEFHTHIAEFKLGDGPCGKCVTMLDVQRLAVGHTALLRIIQWHDDGTIKNFEYDYEYILGRVEIDKL